MTKKLDLRQLHPDFFTEDGTANGRAIYQWSLHLFTPLTYHRPEAYVKALVNYIIRRDQLATTPEFTDKDASRLSALRANKRTDEIPERHALEAKRDAIAYASAMLFGAQIELNRHSRRLTKIDIEYIHDLLAHTGRTVPTPIETEFGKIAVL